LRAFIPPAARPCVSPRGSRSPWDAAFCSTFVVNLVRHECAGCYEVTPALALQPGQIARSSHTHGILDLATNATRTMNGANPLSIASLGSLAVVKPSIRVVVSPALLAIIPAVSSPWIVLRRHISSKQRLILKWTTRSPVAIHMLAS
jgi:hypothetical protein